ncbi:esterase-like activity of phytase family protein [Spirulina major]|uniref:esterase-like activity of phytase family protein n=1 Tax=Spirulina major TaxID=270636 RepID=UPI000934316E
MKIMVRLIVLLCCVLLTACAPSVAQERQFLPLQAELINSVTLPQQELDGTPIGGLSGLTYDRTTETFYAISDDRSNEAPARAYRFQIEQNDADGAIARISFDQVITLKDSNGEPFAPGTLDPEGIAFTPRHTLMISSEGNLNRDIAPWIQEFDPSTGQALRSLRLPARFLPATPIRDPDPPHGIRNNLGLESLDVQWTGLSPDDPFRLFTAPESHLTQDERRTDTDGRDRIRLLHYLINPFGDPVLVSENAYLLEPAPEGSLSHGLSDLLTLNEEGHLLTLERSLTLNGYTARLFQVVAGNATDTSRIATLGGELTTVAPLKKRLLLDLSTLNIPLDNLEGMTLGPRLADGSSLLVLVSDDNFSAEQVTHFLFFRLMEGQLTP